MAEAAMMVGPAVSAAGALEKGKMTSRSLQSQAALQDSYAQEAEQQGAFDAQRQVQIANQKVGTSIAAYGASGVSGESASVGDVLHASAMNSEIDRQNILHQADLKAINFQNQAAMDRYGAESALKGSYWEALGDIAGGAGKAAGAGIGGGNSGGAANLSGANAVPMGSTSTAGGGEGAATYA